MKRRIIMGIICLVVLSVVCTIIPKSENSVSKPISANTSGSETLIIDAGHGGLTNTTH